MVELCEVFCYCLLWLDRCLETIYVCIWRMFVFMSVVVTVWGSVKMFVVQRLLLKIVFFKPWGVEVCCVFV